MGERVRGMYHVWRAMRAAEGLYTVTFFSLFSFLSFVFVFVNDAPETLHAEILNDELY